MKEVLLILRFGLIGVALFIAVDPKPGIEKQALMASITVAICANALPKE